MGSPAAGEEDLVLLDQNHPGFRDEVYRQRRNEIARLALAYVPGHKVPDIEYTDVEEGVWRTVWENLAPLHEKWACAEYRRGAAKLAFSRLHIPQLSHVNEKLQALSGFSMVPVGGLVSSRAFLGNLKQNRFLSTQYIRHHSVPLYTPEPDIVHELAGHAGSLSDPGFAELNRLFGRTAERASDEVLKKIERVYWYTLEFGALREAGGLKAYGAGLISSFGELERFSTEAKLLPFDIEEMANRPYDPTVYQEVIFVAPSFAEASRRIREWLKQVAPQHG